MSPLAGVRVVDLTDGMGGLCGRYLADLGADVILVEPPTGARSRRQPPLHEGASLFFAAQHANKRGVTLDPTAPAGRERLRRLLATADIVVGGALDADRLLAEHPGLVVVSITDFGRTGPYRDWVATDWVHQAMAGVLSRSGIPGQRPLLPPETLAYSSAAIQAAWAALLAYLNRLESGRGDHVDCSVYEMAAQSLDPGHGVGGSAMGGVPAGDLPRGRPDAQHLYPIFRCADGHVRICLLAKRQWRGMFAWLGEPAEFADPALDGLRARFAAAPRLYRLIGELFAPHTRDALVAEGQRRGVPIAALLAAGEVLASEHFAARGVFTDVHGGRMPAGLVELDGVRAGVGRPAPAPGEHNDEVFATLGPPKSGAPTPGPPRHPLAGLRVLDLGVIVVGAELGRLLADQGAEVIKIENRAFPDGGRQSLTGEAMTASFARGNRNKLSLGLNLRSADGVALFKRLVSVSDVVLSNFKPGTMESLGLGYEQLRAVNPGIVVADSSAFGPTGPWSQRMGYGPLVRAATGLTGLWREPAASDDDGGFSDSITIYPDHVAARVGATAVLATLIARRRTGQGGRVSIAQAETILWQLSAQFLRESLAPGTLRPPGNTGEYDAPYGLFPCAGDDEWCVVTVRGDADWVRLCRAIGRADLAALAHLATAAGRLAHRAEVEAALTAWTTAHPPRAAMTRLQAAGVPAGMMQRVADQLDDPQLAERGFLRRLAQPQFAVPLHTENAPAGFRQIADPPLRPAPLAGEHTRQICTNLLGRPDVEIDALVRAGVLEEASMRPVLVQRRDHIMLITLNRPEVRNAVNVEVCELVGAAIEEAERDRDIWAVVLTGAGDKAFCAGADLKAVARGERLRAEGHEHWGFAGYVSHPISKPTIAAVNGFALGGGTEIALASDLVVASETAQFGLPEVKRGIIAGAGGVFRLPAQLPTKVAAEMIFTGEPVDAATAQRLGLVNRVVPQEKVLDEALGLAEAICRNAPLAVQASKRIAQAAVLAAEAASWARVAAEAETLMASDDAREGPRAFAEKRRPVWSGR